jgi:5'(3')-deoxyribonucleotidase
MKVYLDQDGPIANFVKGAFDLFDKEVPDVWPQNEWNIENIIGVSKKDFWKKIDNAGYSFWANLEKPSYFNDLIKLVNDIDPKFHIITSPARNPDSVKGKMIWLQNSFSWNFRRFIFISSESKHHFAGPDRILIDDKPSNIEEWIAAGGTGILFPAVWNTPFDQIPHDSKIVDHIFEKIQRINLT